MTNAHTLLTGRCGVAVVVIAPLVLLTGFALHPWIGAGLPDQSAVAAAAADRTTRWALRTWRSVRARACSSSRSSPPT
jgi:hypothetical protein